ncbi:MAG: LysM peptidoglycan-binding domain-containing protein [Myxococcota bacterium]
MKLPFAAASLLAGATLAGPAAALGGHADEILEHVVQPGETLWSIAEAPGVYGDPLMWPLIYRFNRDQIKDPARIYPGQQLQIPMRPARKDRISARAEAASGSAAGGSER